MERRRDGHGRIHGGATASAAFNGGVSYTDTRTANYQALQTKVNIGQDATVPNKASWTYDSWNSVKANIQPGDHACPKGLRKSEALPDIIYGGTFSPVQSWVWAAQPAVRDQYASTNTLPVTVNTSLLLGWALYPDDSTCGPPSYFINWYWAEDDTFYIVGDKSNPSNPRNGLNFNVGCTVSLQSGTIPLGPPDNPNRTHNSGTPYALPVWVVNIPFAPKVDPTQMTLTGLSPSSGRAGDPVTLSGDYLNTVTTVNFGGIQITNFSYDGSTGTIQVAAPNPPTGTSRVPVSVQNGVKITGTLLFTYQ